MYNKNNNDTYLLDTRRKLIQARKDQVEESHELVASFIDKPVEYFYDKYIQRKSIKKQFIEGFENLYEYYLEYRGLFDELNTRVTPGLILGQVVLRSAFHEGYTPILVDTVFNETEEEGGILGYFKAKMRTLESLLDLSYAFENNILDMEFGHPRLGNGNVCRAFTPVQNLGEHSIGDTLEVLNPRSKKKISLRVTVKITKDYYQAIDEVGKKTYIGNETSISNAYDALFSCNKLIFGGWWAKRLILIK